jgi:hypothetical protein
VSTWSFEQARLPIGQEIKNLAILLCSSAGPKLKSRFWRPKRPV